jgi:hypothetical protein
MKPEVEELSSVLRETILLLCRNGLLCDSDIRVQGLIGITVDSHEVFLVQLDETVTGCLETVTSEPHISPSANASCELPGVSSLPPVECPLKWKQRRRGACRRSATVPQTDIHSQVANVDGSIDSDVITIADDEGDVIGDRVKSEMPFDGPHVVDHANDEYYDVGAGAQVRGLIESIDQASDEYRASSSSDCRDQFNEYAPYDSQLLTNIMGSGRHCAAQGPMTSGRGRAYRLGHRLPVKQVSLQVEQTTFVAGSEFQLYK